MITATFLGNALCKNNVDVTMAKMYTNVDIINLKNIPLRSLRPTRVVGE